MKLSEQNIRTNAMDVITSLVFPRLHENGYTEQNIRMMLLAMIITHGENAVNDMYGWYLWALEYTDRDMDEIMVSIWHDLAGRNDKTMLPRTSGYMKDYLEWEEKVIDNQKK